MLAMLNWGAPSQIIKFTPESSSKNQAIHPLHTLPDHKK